ncbi:glycerol kinase GlpK [Oscillospiraceae bacterium HV4-5-C5C]|nr:glycerol kinase GlpK [Oscillospiraceae bacterium HV4-5-C5C]
MPQQIPALQSDREKPYILAIDQGTTSSRAILFDHDGRPVSQQQLAITQYYPQAGWVEHDADEIWSSVVSVCRNLLRQTGLGWPQIAAIGLTNQRETVVVWDARTGEPVSRAIVWQCRRTQDLCERLKARGCQAEIVRRTGLELDAYFSATKLAWILDQLPEGRERARRGELLAGTIDSWLVWKLSGGRSHVTDVTNAARTMLFNIHELAWDPWLLQLLDIPSELLPAVKPSSGIVAWLDSQELLTADLLEGRGSSMTPVPIAGLAGDQMAALFGQACFEPGMVKNTYGTGGFILMQTGKVAVPSTHRLVTTLAWQLGPDQGATPQFPVNYALEGSVFNCGSTIQWLRDELGLIGTAHDCDVLAASVQDSGGVVLVPSFTGLGAPYWDMNARGVLMGLTRGSNKAHICRAALEAIAFQSADVCLAMAADSQQPLRTLRVDGGVSRSDLMLQFQADILGLTIQRSSVLETSALGAAYLAGLSTGFWNSLDEVSQAWHCEREFKPRMDRRQRSYELARWQQAVDTVRFNSDRRRTTEAAGP